jgi:hypothetical protein
MITPVVPECGVCPDEVDGEWPDELDGVEWLCPADEDGFIDDPELCGFTPCFEPVLPPPDF